MKHLNNQQLILLAVLVSFVTSTATGIFTVALLSEAPEGVTNTINRVVERTVQVVTQPAVERVVEKKEERIVEEGSKLVQQVVEKGTPSIVTLVVKKSETGEGGGTTDDGGVFVRKGTGVVIDASGKILTLSSVVDQKVPYYLLNEGGTSTPTLIALTLEKSDSDVGLAQFKIASLKTETYQAMTISKNAVSIGQTAVVWGSRGVSVSFVSSVLSEKGKSLYRVYIDSTDPLPGRIVSNIGGELVGLLRSDNTLISTAIIEEFLPVDKKEPAST